MNSIIWEKEDRKAFFAPSLPAPFSFVALLIALLSGGLMALFEPYLIVGALALVAILVFKQYEVAAGCVLLVSLYIDWYLDYRVAALVLAPLLLLLLYLSRSPERPWTEPKAWWLWALFLGLSIYPAIRGALTIHDLILYYPSVILGALIMFWLGLLIGRDIASVRRFFIVVAALATLIAVHTIIQATTGITLLQSQAALAYLESVSNYQFPGETVYRLGSFFIQPNFNGMFLAMMAFIPFGLFVESRSIPAKLLFLGETLLIVTGLLFTYSASAWIGVSIAVVVFILLVGEGRYRLQISLFLLIAIAVLLLGFPSQVNLLLQHASDPAEIQLRNAVWQTALRVIAAYPLTGVGLGHQAYLERAEPFRVIGQVMPYDHPHNSYLEWGAMAGLPVLFVFVILLAFTVWQALRNWIVADARARSLLGAAIAGIVVLCFTSWSNQGWTLPTLAACGWMLLGCITSPLLRNSLLKEKERMVEA